MNTALYQSRRAALSRHLGPRGVAIVPTAREQQRNRDSDFLFRADSYFHYLCGFTEPNAWLVLTGEGHCTLFCQPKDLEREIWDGIRLGPDAAPATLGVDAAFSVAQLDQQLPLLLDGAEGQPVGFDAQGQQRRPSGEGDRRDRCRRDSGPRRRRPWTGCP